MPRPSSHPTTHILDERAANLGWAVAAYLPVLQDHLEDHGTPLHLTPPTPPPPPRPKKRSKKVGRLQCIVFGIDSQTQNQNGLENDTVIFPIVHLFYIWLLQHTIEDVHV
jgi:hypothetical protein